MQNFTELNSIKVKNVELARKVNFLLIYLRNFNQRKGLEVVALIMDVSFAKGIRVNFHYFMQKKSLWPISSWTIIGGQN